MQFIDGCLIVKGWPRFDWTSSSVNGPGLLRWLSHADDLAAGVERGEEIAVLDARFVFGGFRPALVAIAFGRIALEGIGG